MATGGLFPKIAFGGFIVRPLKKGITWPTAPSKRAQVGIPCQQKDQEHDQGQLRQGSTR